MSKHYWRMGVQIHRFDTVRGKLISRQIGLANNVHVAQQIIDALNAQDAKR